MTQRHEWGHQSDLKQPSQAQGIFNLAVVACFGGNVFPWLQKWARFAHYTTVSPDQEQGPFLEENPDSELKPLQIQGGTKNHNQREKGAFWGESTKNDSQHHFLNSPSKHLLSKPFSNSHWYFQTGFE